MTAGVRRRVRGGRVPEAMLAVAGLACLGWWAWQVAAADRFQHDAARELARERTGVSSAPLPAMREVVTPSRPAVPPAKQPPRSSPTLAAGVVGRIDVPVAKISAMVAAGDDDRTLARAVGLVRGTPLPGAHGRTVLAGHRDTWFRGLGRVRQGDAIRVTTATGRYEYRVTRTTIVDPHDVGILQTGPDPGLVLVTCWPFHYVGPAPERFIVQAELVATDDAMTLASLAAPVVPATALATAPPRMRVAAAHAVRPAQPRAHRASVMREPVATRMVRRSVHDVDAPRRRARPPVVEADAPAKVKRTWDDRWALR